MFVFLRLKISSLIPYLIDTYPSGYDKTNEEISHHMSPDRLEFNDIASDPRNILVSEKDAAKLLSWEVRTLQQRRYRGQNPPYVRIGRNIRYRLSELMEMVRAGEVKPQRGSSRND